MPLDDRTGGFFHHARRDTVFFRPCSPEDLPAVAEMEANSYPPDEKASPEALAFRQQNANEFFLVGMRMSDTEAREAATEAGDASASAADALVSYVCGTLTTGTTLTHESMSEHDPSGTTLCVHSVVTCGSSRREGIGTKTLRAYCRWVATRFEEIDVILLLCKKHLIGFYEGAGFKMVGESSVVHGADQWYEMRLKTAFVRAVACSEVTVTPTRDIAPTISSTDISPERSVSNALKAARSFRTLPAPSGFGACKNARVVCWARPRGRSM